MLTLNNKVLAQVFFWFGVTMGIFGIATEISQQTIYMTTSFYLSLSVIGFLASISVSNLDR